MATSNDARPYGVAVWLRAVQDPDSAWNRTLKTICADRENLYLQARDMAVRTLDAFGSRYGMARKVVLIRSAGRVNVLGTHIDHRGGSVNPVAVHHMWLVVSPREDDRIIAHNVESDSFPEEQFCISQCLPQGRGIDDWDHWCHEEFRKRRGDCSTTWSTYVRAAVLYLQHIHTNPGGVFIRPLKGMDMMFYGDVPRAAGVSSSSAVVVATAEAVNRLNQLDISPREMVARCGQAEWYVGTRGGSSDHAAIIYGQANAISHLTAFPSTATKVGLPEGYDFVLANSCVEAEKQAAARNVFNSRIAAYEFGFMMICRQFPEYGEKLKYLRDVNPSTLGISEAEVYRIVRSLPRNATRAEIGQMLPGSQDDLHRVFESHGEPEEGYPIRGVCLYGITECIRANRVPECLRDGDVHQFGELMNISHDGDRVMRWDQDESVRIDKDYFDERLDELIADLESGDPVRRERARLWRQSGAYDCSLPEVDALVDVALSSDGVVGAGLVGAGMGGCVVAIVRSNRVKQLIANMAEKYYSPRGWSPKTEIIVPVGGLQTFEL